MSPESCLQLFTLEGKHLTKSHKNVGYCEVLLMVIKSHWSDKPIRCHKRVVQLNTAKQPWSKTKTGLQNRAWHKCTRTTNAVMKATHERSRKGSLSQVQHRKEGTEMLCCSSKPRATLGRAQHLPGPWVKAGGPHLAKILILIIKMLFSKSPQCQCREIDLQVRIPPDSTLGSSSSGQNKYLLRPGKVSLLSLMRSS